MKDRIVRDENHLQTMKPWTRRGVLAGFAALAARPAFGQNAAPPAADVDVIIVGAGAAGIAAARTLAAAGRTFTLVEATGRIGGRCVTETRSFGFAFDRGAHWISSPDTNPLTKLAARTGLEIYPAPSAQRVRIGRRNAREGELEDYLTASVRANRAIGEAARGKTDVDCRSALPKDLGDWRSTIEFTLGPYAMAHDLDEVSAQDFGKLSERDVGAFCRQGYGGLLAKLAEGIPVVLDSPVTDVGFPARGSSLTAVTPKGKLTGQYMIVTASTAVLASDRIKFEDGLPRRQLEALGKLKLGSFDHIALEIPGNPFGLQRDDLVFERSSGPRTASLLANVSGTPLSLIGVGGRFGRDLVAKGDDAAVEFVVDWLASLFGTNIKRLIQRRQVTHWNREPWTLGAFATASPGGQWARKALMEPIRGRVFLAGEAVHETSWGTVAGAWESGARAANLVLRRIAGLPDLEAPKPEPARPQSKRPQPKPKPRPSRVRHRRPPPPQ
jgi:monoamine oxidase